MTLSGSVMDSEMMRNLRGDYSRVLDRVLSEYQE
jgi:hypothetical protein